MPRPRNTVPIYKKHPTRDEARCWVNNKWVYLGRWRSQKSLREYERICTELRVAAAESVAPDLEPLTVGEVLLAFGRHAATHYRRPDGTPPSEVRAYHDALGPIEFPDRPRRGEGVGPTPVDAHRHPRLLAEALTRLHGAGSPRMTRASESTVNARSRLTRLPAVGKSWIG